MFRKQKKTNAERETETLKTSAAPRNSGDQNRRLAATNNFSAPMENAETGSEQNSTKTPGTNENPGKVGHLSLY
jgi:hypothetical protein